MSALASGSRGAVAILLGCCLIAAQSCAHWQDRREPPAVVLRDHDPGAVRVTRTDGSRFVLRDPRLDDGRLVGVASDSLVVLPLADVAAVALREQRLATTVAVIAGLGALAVLVFALTFNPFES